MQKPKLYTVIAIALMVLSCILFGFMFVVPFLPLTKVQKGLSVSVLFIAMEITWWVGVAIIGKQVIMKYKKYLNPRNWFSPKNNIMHKEEEQA